MSTVGLIANPNAGKDVRRLVSAASPTSDMAKIGIIRRAIIGAVEGGAERIVAADDRHALAARAIDGLDVEAELVVLDEPVRDSGRNSTVAALRLREADVGAVIVLGGDGTHRDVALGWRDVPLVALSTGTNNVFPRQNEATIAGHAAGAVAAKVIALGDVARQAKTLAVSGAAGGGESEDDLALVDVALVATRFTSSRAIWEAGSVREIVAAIAEPEAVGLSSIAAAVAPISRDEPGGVHVRMGRGQVVRAPIGPGLYADVDVAAWVQLIEGEGVQLHGPGAVAFDGERDRVLHAGEALEVRIRTDGPLVIDVPRAIAAARRVDASSRERPPSATDG